MPSYDILLANSRNFSIHDSRTVERACSDESSWWWAQQVPLIHRRLGRLLVGGVGGGDPRLTICLLVVMATCKGIDREEI
jgi:hypothetical protein